MLVTEGNLSTKAGVNVPMRAVFAESRSGTLVREREKFWTYDPVNKAFTALPVDRIGQESTVVIYKVTTELGGVVHLPEAASLLIEKHGMETLVGVRAMCTFRNWSACKISRAKVEGTVDPVRYWDTIKSIEVMDRPKTEEEELPVFSIKGSAGTSRLMVVDSFLVG